MGKAVQAMQTAEVNAQFIEDDNYIEMGLIEDQRKEFPTPSEEENETDTDEDESENSINNNARVLRPKVVSATGSKSLRIANRNLPDTSEGQPMETEVSTEDNLN